MLALGLSALVMLSGCASKPIAPPEFLEAVFPDAPTRLNTVVDSVVIKLDWSYNGATPVARFNIYRQHEQSAPRLIGTSIQQQFIDDGDLSENEEYGYSVSAVLASGYEGARSETVFTVFAPGGVPSEAFMLTPVALDTFPTALLLSWTGSEDSSNFAAYQIYRSTTPEVDFNSVAITTITSRTKLNYIDTTVLSSTVYYYRLFVFNRRGRFSASNIVTARTRTEVPPIAVTLSQPAQVSGGVRLTWSRSVNQDFASYRIYRSTFSPVDASGLAYSIINSAQTTTYDDLGLSPGVVYFYVVAVYDRSGLSAVSNEVSIRAQ